MKKTLLMIVILSLFLGLTGCDEPEITNNEMVLVESGTTTVENGNITTSEDFYIGKYHVTQSEFKEVMEFNPSSFSGFLISTNPDNPVENVTWYDAVKYCNELSKEEGLDKYYDISDIEYDGDNIMSAKVKENDEADGYRLPTETEHEYAARGGTYGEPTTFAGSDDMDQVGWYNNNSNDKTQPVGKKEANELSLYDFSGNVWDWTNSSYDAEDYNKITRGGSWIGSKYDCEVEKSYNGSSSTANNVRGFRIARDS